MKSTVNHLNEFSPPRGSRRSFLKWVRNGLIVGGGMLGWTGLVEPFWLEINHQVLPLPNLPQHWHHRRLIHVSDFHVGQTNQTYLQRAMEAINELEPDLLLVTGDWIDRKNGDADLESVLERLKPAKIATIGSLGNHDYGPNYKDLECAERVVSLCQKHEIRILRNEKITIDELDIFGLKDFWSPQFDEDLYVIHYNTDPTRASICLCHNPDVCDLPIWGDFRGWIFAGHTHGGQCKPPFLPPPLLPVVNRRYTSGAFQLDAKRRLYITRGVGYSFQVRFNCRPEITVFQLENVAEMSS